jgi:hypothetical protein
MRTYVIAAIATAALILPTVAFSAEVDVGPGGVRIGTGHYHHHDRYYGYHRDHFHGPHRYHHDY